MAKTKGQTFGAIWRYQGPRGVVWRIRYRDATGKRILETLGTEPEWTRSRAKTELRRRLVDVEREGYRRPEHTHLADFARSWLADYLPARGLKPTTLAGYRHAIQGHLIPALGTATLRELERHPELIDRYVARKLAHGLSPKTVTNQLLVLQLVMKRAVRLRLIGRNPLLDVERPRLEQTEMNVLTEAEIARLWTAYGELQAEADGDERVWWEIARTITFVALGTAMRRGELLALRWRDVHLLAGHLQVREALVRGQFTTPKSRASRRLIELGPRTTKLLAAHWKRSAFSGEDELVFCHPQLGTPLDPSRLARAHLRPALKRAGITKPFRAFHDLRHTALTHEAAAGNPMAYVQMKAGHSQTQITERYIHAAQVLFPGAAAKGEARMFALTDDAGNAAAERPGENLPAPGPTAR
jgi:integrase